ncbi:MAG: helix-turn-helix domain-containing protein [Clostridia bacterium]|nr:helix-turn-helix domain-containing protein [Clostridia bacterium]
MEIINTIQQNGTDVVRLFYSLAQSRKKLLRIHYHSMIELSLILRGRGVYHTPKCDYSIAAGDIFFFRPNESHYITDIDSPDMLLLNLHIAPYYLYANPHQSLTPECMGILSSNCALESYKINDLLTQEQAEVIKTFVNGIFYEMQSEQIHYDICINNYISMILIHLARSLQVDAAHDITDRNAYQRIGAAIEYIDLHFRENITLDMIAAEVGYSRCYFSTVFRKCIGMTPWNYISIKRIEEALTLIKTTDRSILDIALACGFNNTANFCKIFKKYTNLVPSSFRS